MILRTWKVRKLEKPYVLGGPVIEYEAREHAYGRDGYGNEVDRETGRVSVGVSLDHIREKLKNIGVTKVNQAERLEDGVLEIWW